MATSFSLKMHQAGYTPMHGGSRAGYFSAYVRALGSRGAVAVHDEGSAPETLGDPVSVSISPRNAYDSVVILDLPSVRTLLDGSAKQAAAAWGKARTQDFDRAVRVTGKDVSVLLDKLLARGSKIRPSLAKAVSTPRNNVQAIVGYDDLYDYGHEVVLFGVPGAGADKRDITVVPIGRSFAVHIVYPGRAEFR